MSERHTQDKLLNYSLKILIDVETFVSNFLQFSINKESIANWVRVSVSEHKKNIPEVQYMTIMIIGMLRLKGRAYFNNLYLSQVCPEWDI